MMNDETQNEFSLALHQGMALMLVASKYPTLLEVLLECIQNGLDKGASAISVVVDYVRRTAHIRDNGNGASVDEFKKALKTVCVSKKSVDKLGRFGIGLVSPLDKCEQFTFTSTPKSDAHAYKRWTFRAEEIRVCESNLTIPMKEAPELWYCTKPGKQGVPWRTEVALTGFTKDKLLSRVTVEGLREEILDRFTETMRRRGTLVRIAITDADSATHTEEVVARDYEGKKLPEWTHADTDGGTTYVRLYLARRKARGKAGKVKIGEYGNDFRISFPLFHANLPVACKMSDSLIAALKSGFFEGDILSGRAKFNSNRRSFVANDALVAFCIGINEWWREVGSALYKEAAAAHREEQYQNLGVNSLKVVDALLKDGAGSALLDAIGTFKKGTIGTGHVDVPGREQTAPAKAIYGGIRGGADSGTAKGEPATEKKGHHPLVSTGPSGAPRRVVRSNSLGIVLQHEALESDRSYVLDAVYGILTINLRHPDWVRVEEEANDKALGRFEEFLILQALTIQSLPEDFRDFARLAGERVISAYAFMVINADDIAGRAPFRKGTSAPPNTGKKG